MKTTSAERFLIRCVKDIASNVTIGKVYVAWPYTNEEYGCCFYDDTGSSRHRPWHEFKRLPDCKVLRTLWDCGDAGRAQREKPEVSDESD